MNNTVLNNEIIVCLINSKEQILLQKRSEYEKHNPNKWSICAGHIEPYDISVEAAVVREVKEELGIDISETNLIEVSIGDNNTHFYYTIINNNNFVLQEKEVSEVKWYYIDDVINMMTAKNDNIVYSERIIKLLYKIKEMLK